MILPDTRSERNLVHQTLEAPNRRLTSESSRTVIPICHGNLRTLFNGFISIATKFQQILRDF